jgi:hypothetical protein
MFRSRYGGARAVHRTVYGYGRMVYDRKPYNKWALPVSVPYGRITDDMSCIASQVSVKVRRLMLQYVGSIY